MGSNFLLKEKDLRKINADLELKTKELMKEYESVMRRQDHFADGINRQQSATERQVIKRARSLSTTTIPSRCSPTRQTQSAGQHLPRAAGQQWTNTTVADCIVYKADGKGDEEPLGANKGLGTEALINFLRANVKVLQEEVQSLQADCKARAEECREQQAQLKCLGDECDKWRQLATNSKEQIKKLEHQCSIAATKQQQRETENLSLRKEIELRRKELKTCTQAASSSDVRLNRCLENTEKLKALLKQIKQEKKEFQDESRKKTSELISVVKGLERQKLELISGFKKQMQLIDNLTRQKMLLEAGRVIQFAEREFLKLLDSAPENL